MNRFSVPFALLRYNGDLVLLKDNDKIVWESFDTPLDTCFRTESFQLSRCLELLVRALDQVIAAFTWTEARTSSGLPTISLKSCVFNHAVQSGFSASRLSFAHVAQHQHLCVLQALKGIEENRGTRDRPRQARSLFMSPRDHQHHQRTSPSLTLSRSRLSLFVGFSYGSLLSISLFSLLLFKILSQAHASQDHVILASLGDHLSNSSILVVT
ncbi:hypothetical protein F2Q69_00054948 [Brassica cretica]|uniref:Bulb-type lectin domain-containing protein n=1 Tax=Brassica cretica TaxID=69181 RepID=A0A8S9MVW7_BRACR|nr:hypothetical protein F2Q69_00054948 [Brassica cretica]